MIGFRVDRLFATARRHMQLITSQDDARLSAALENQAHIGVDTEFMRERTYFAQLCLLQVATPGEIFCVDPLAAGSLDASWDALLNCDWVLHSGRQDIEVVYQATGRMPTSVFDTQIAMALLGFAPQLGYAALVNELFGKELPKSHTRADWSKRPLSDAMLVYAAEDVEFLLDAHALLGERLAELGRADWAREDSMLLLDRALYDIDANGAVDRLKGAAKLRGRARRAAIGMANWREQRAIKSNRPRRWILKDTVVLDIAIKNPGDETELASIDDMPAATARRSGAEILEVLQAAENGNDSYEPPTAPDDQQKAMLKEMQKTVAAVAGDLGVAAEIIAPRKELVAAISGVRETRMFTGWRRTLIGESLLAVLADA